jgi:hypothetical protein
MSGNMMGDALAMSKSPVLLTPLTVTSAAPCGPQRKSHSIHAREPTYSVTDGTPGRRRTRSRIWSVKIRTGQGAPARSSARHRIISRMEKRSTARLSAARSHVRSVTAATDTGYPFLRTSPTSLMGETAATIVFNTASWLHIIWDDDARAADVLERSRRVRTDSGPVIPWRECERGLCVSACFVRG